MIKQALFAVEVFVLFQWKLILLLYVHCFANHNLPRTFAIFTTFSTKSSKLPEKKHFPFRNSCKCCFLFLSSGKLDLNFARQLRGIPKWLSPRSLSRLTLRWKHFLHELVWLNSQLRIHKSSEFEHVFRTKTVQLQWQKNNNFNWSLSLNQHSV